VYSPLKIFYTIQSPCCSGLPPLTKHFIPHACTKRTWIKQKPVKRSKEYRGKNFQKSSSI